jgi:DUF4097 and DUF4098 domain-containing protein YvlB
MPTDNFDGIETLRIERARGNLKIAGGAGPGFSGLDDADTSRDGSTLDVSIRSNASITVPPGVTIEIVEVAGNLELRDLAAPVTLDKVKGSLRASKVGAINIRERAANNVRLEHAGAIEAERVSGSLTVEDAASIQARQVDGEVECGIVGGAIAIERIAGSARLYEVRGKITSHLVAGSLEVADTETVEVSVVGGKVRATQVNGELGFGKIGGKFVVDAATGDVAAGFVGGRVSITRAGGKVELFDVGGAVDIRGPFAAGASCTVKSRGRINVEIDPTASLKLNASAGWGRVRIYGVDESGLKRASRSEVEGTIGPEPQNGERTLLDLETTTADIIVASASADTRDYYSRESRFGRGFAGQFEDFAAELGEEIPDFVSSVVGAVGKFVSQSGVASGGFAQNVGRDVTRGIREAIEEIERVLADVQQRVPDHVKEKLNALGRELRDLLNEATKAGANATREERARLKERIRDAAREMRNTIREASRAARRGGRASSYSYSSSSSKSESSSAAQSSGGAGASSASDDIPRPGTTVKLSREEAVLQILRAVKEGRLEPEEADDLINAWNREGASARGN